MKTRYLLLSALFALALPVRPAVIAIDFRDSGGSVIDDTSGISGYIWNSFNGVAPGGALVDVTGAFTGLQMTTLNAGGFESNSRGETIDATGGGHSFPSTVTDSYLADNDDSGRNGLISLRFAASEQYSFTFTILTSQDHSNITDDRHVGAFNVGGTYTLNSGFTGGATILLDAQPNDLTSLVNYSVGTLVAGVANTTVGSNFVMDFQAGATNGSGSVFVNGLILEVIATGRAIPEPSSLGLLALGIGLLRRSLRARSAA